MRSLVRPRPTPPTLGQGGLGEQAHHDNVNRPPQEDKKLPGHWTRPDVRGALRAMSGFACCWCGSDFSGSSSSVEHWRPKNSPREDLTHIGYWWLAYTWDNLFLACGRCQQSRGSSFPITGNRATSEANLNNEQPQLVHPIQQAFESLITIDMAEGWPCWDLRPNAPTNAKDIVKKSIELLKLRDVDFTRSFNKALRVAEDLATDKKWDELKKNAMIHREFSFVSRLVLDAQKPDFLPTLAEQYLDLTQELIGRWQDIEQAPKEEISDAIKKDQRWIAWAIAYIWITADTTTRSQIEQLLQSHPKLLIEVMDHKDTLQAIPPPTPPS